jgi:dTDP-4-amino-4,6-dideoxygalactose transaminase
MSGDELAMVREAFESNWVAPLGPHVDAFEREMAQRIGVEHACALSSGTAGLHLALLGLGVSSGDEVLTSTLTFAATANAITYVGARPVFVDSERASWNMDPELLADELARLRRAGRRPAAVVVVDLYGQCADYDRICAVCAEHGVPLVEDAAEALGATYSGRPAGSFGEISVFSFNGNKIITTGGGGMLVSASPEHVARARFMATQARDPAPHYEHSTIGYNYRLSNVLAAIGRAQLRVLDDRVERRRAIFSAYREALAGLPGIAMMPEPASSRSTRWLTCLTIDPADAGVSRDDLRVALEREDIEARPVWKPMHLQPVFRDCRFVGTGVADELFARGLCLPSGSSLTNEELGRVIHIVAKEMAQ